MTERDLNKHPRMPEDVYEQLINLPVDIEQGKICKRVFNEIGMILNSNGILFDLEKSSHRVKSREDIRKKSITRGSLSPVRDIYGVRFIVNETDRYRIQSMVQSHYPLTPETFSDGRPSIREYADPEVRSYIRGKFNSNIGEYSALHINVVFQREGSEILDIAEIQIMTDEEFQDSHATRSSYTNGRRAPPTP